jgi:hypothetical protein
MFMCNVDPSALETLLIKVCPVSISGRNFIKEINRNNLYKFTAEL